MTRKIGTPRAVIAREFLEENVPLRDAWVGALKDSRDISRIIGKIGKYLPSMSHLKRCSSKRLVLAFATCDNDETAGTKNHEIGGDADGKDRIYLSRCDIETLLINRGLDMSLFEKEFEIIRVPESAARTKAQALAASKIWPLNFHPDPMVESILNGSWFDNEQLDSIDRCMRVCIEVALRGEARGTNECNGSALVYDPIAGKIMAIAASRIDHHPMWHAAILAVDLVARLGNGGAYELSTNEPHQIDEGRNDSAESFPNSRKRKYPRKEKKKAPLAYPENLIDLARPYPTENRTTIETMKDEKEKELVAYLCTNYWVFLLREPCSLCAMALVHSRVSDIFYGIPNEYRGVLGSRAMLHTIPGLNHRYRVWRGIREEECRSIFNELSRLPI